MESLALRWQPLKKVSERGGCWKVLMVNFQMKFNLTAPKPVASVLEATQ